MGKAAGNKAIFTIQDSGGTVRDLSNFINGVDGLPGATDTYETTGLSMNSKSYIAGLKDGQFALKGIYDDTATTGPDAVLGGLFNGGSIVSGALGAAFVFGPGGSTTGLRKYTGTAVLKSYKISAPVNGLVTWAADFVCNGDVVATVF